MSEKGPLEQFREDWQQAKSLKDPNAPYCFLATVSKEGHAAVRTLVLREVAEQEFAVFLNNTGPKWEQLQSKRYELLAFWPLPMLQYRLSGTFTEIDTETMKQNWDSKDYNAKLLDHYYLRYHPQSSLVASRQTFLEGIEILRNEYPQDQEIPFPSNIRGIQLVADHVEEWRGSPEDRLHERYLYILEEGYWSKSVMVP